MKEDTLTKRRSAVFGCLLGTTVGDALGLPRENLSAVRAEKLFGPATRHRFLYRHGVPSDDTDHSCLVAVALANSRGEVQSFERSFSRLLRVWFLSFPAGIGLATLRACVKLCLGYGPARSGVYSAGNGPAMRAAIIGVSIPEERIAPIVLAATRVTHTDPDAFHSALVVALTAHLASMNTTIEPDALLLVLHKYLHDASPNVQSAIERTVAASSMTTREFAATLGLGNGVTGYALHTVPICIHAWLTNQGDYLKTVRATIECGGDADTTGAIAGALAGAQLGSRGVPQELEHFN